jgi:hypothetical protein
MDMGMWDEYIAIVDQYFKYLETEFGFMRVSTEPSSIEYESVFVRISIFWDYWGNRELDLAVRPFKKMDSLGRAFGISRLAALHHKNYISPFPDTKEELDAAIKGLAELLQECCLSILRGDLRDLERIQKIRNKADKGY